MGVEYGLSASGLGGCPSLPAPSSELGTAKGSARIQDAQVPKPKLSPGLSVCLLGHRGDCLKD